ncbi:MAG: hypothetical protein AVDCRST_MAG36-108, partial [uncultured Nocardioidaceae bacterium]
ADGATLGAAQGPGVTRGRPAPPAQRMLQPVARPARDRPVAGLRARDQRREVRRRPHRPQRPRRTRRPPARGARQRPPHPPLGRRGDAGAGRAGTAARRVPGARVGDDPRRRQPARQERVVHAPQDGL